jgi:hypothetical protein
MTLIQRKPEKLAQARRCPGQCAGWPSLSGSAHSGRPGPREHAAEAAYTNADWAAAAEQAEAAYRQGDDARSAARAQVIAGRALRQWGRSAQGREQLAAAVAVLQDDPDADTVRALGELAALEVFAGTPAADALSAEALALGQDLAVDEAALARLFAARGLCHSVAGRNPQAAASFREAARLAGQAGDTVQLGGALLNLADAVTGTDPAAGAEAARAAAAQLRRAGARDLLAVAVENLAQALLMTGDWDAAGAELAQAADADGLAGLEYLACYRAWVAALRGEAPAAQAILAGLGGLRASEDPQDQAVIAAAEAFTAAALGQPAAALRHARAALDHAAALGISAEYLRWACRWPPAPRTTWPTPPPPPATCWPCSTATSPGSWPPCSGPNATWPAPAWPPTAARTPQARRSPPSPGCASTPPPTTWPTACSTTPPTWPPAARPEPPRPRPAKPPASQPGWAASR